MNGQVKRAAPESFNSRQRQLKGRGTCVRVYNPTHPIKSLYIHLKYIVRTTSDKAVDPVNPVLGSFSVGCQEVVDSSAGLELKGTTFHNNENMFTSEQQEK